MKYAIYEKKTRGLFAVEYIDDPNELKKYPYINKDSLPVVINDAGGYSSFNSDSGFDGSKFVKIVEVQSNKYPLTLNERFPMDKPVNYGWLSPLGKFYPCEYEEHFELAEVICKEILNIDIKMSHEYFNGEDYLEKHNWGKVTTGNPYSNNKYIKSYPFVYTNNFYLTKKQCDFLIESKFYDKGCEIKELINESLKRNI